MPKPPRAPVLCIARRCNLLSGSTPSAALLHLRSEIPAGQLLNLAEVRCPRYTATQHAAWLFPVHRSSGVYCFLWPTSKSLSHAQRIFVKMRGQRSAVLRSATDSCSALCILLRDHGRLRSQSPRACRWCCVNHRPAHPDTAHKLVVCWWHFLAQQWSRGHFSLIHNLQRAMQKFGGQQSRLSQPWPLPSLLPEQQVKRRGPSCPLIHALLGLPLPPVDMMPA